MGEKIKIAVVGAGWWGTTAHLPSLLKNPRVETVALVDKNPEALQRAATAFNLSTAYPSLSDALAAHPDLRGAVVAVPHAAHHAAARECLDHGLHLLLEKPMTLTAQEARDLTTVAAQKGLHILIGYVYPYLDQIKAAKRHVDSGILGDLEYITCHMSSMAIEFLRGKPEAYAPLFNYPVTGPTRKTYSDPALAGGGQGHLQVTHSVGLMFHLAGSLRADTVSAFMSNLDCNVDVVDAMIVRMTNGAVATVGSTGNLGQRDGGIVEIHLHGSQGRLRVDAISGEMYLRLHNGHEERIAPSAPGYLQEIPAQRLVEIILDGAENPNDGQTVGLRTVELIEAGYRSARQDGAPVKVASLYS